MYVCVYRPIDLRGKLGANSDYVNFDYITYVSSQTMSIEYYCAPSRRGGTFAGREQGKNIIC